MNCVLSSFTVGRLRFALWLARCFVIYSSVSRFMEVRQTHWRLFLWQIQNLVLTPQGIMVDRRKTPRYTFHERRITELARRWLQMWLYTPDDNPPSHP